MAYSLHKQNSNINTGSLLLKELEIGIKYISDIHLHGNGKKQGYQKEYKVYIARFKNLRFFSSSTFQSEVEVVVHTINPE